ncbi:indolepyruvate oxidoreductase subunit beta [bacterium]|nr:indolepyruvate oxidoreductase subunit beta [bacterium]
MTGNTVTNVVVAGLGGQGVLKASDILAEAAFRAGLDIKKSEIHGMSQRGGSVTSDVRFGKQVLSPMIPTGQADYLLVIAADQIEPNRHLLREGGVLITPDAVDPKALPHARSLNVALLGILSSHLEIPEDIWLDAVRANLKENLHGVNEEAFALGRGASQS